MDVIFTANTFKSPLTIRKLWPLWPGQPPFNAVHEHGLQKLTPIYKITLD